MSITNGTPSAAALAILLACSLSHAASYYISPTGDDTKDGRAEATAWKTCAKVNKAAFQPGDSILFKRGGEWREQLAASSSGTADKPIVYDAYGEGTKPKFLGSDLLNNADFTPAGANSYACKLAAKADAALQDHVFVNCSWNNGTLTITSASDPKSDKKIYTACVRGNVVFTKGKNHLVFRNLIADETAGQLGDGVIQGYGFRVEGSTNVLVEDCEANRCGRHNFGVINSTGFIGRRLRAAYAHPKTPGGNTFYVSYADGGAPAKSCTSEWDDIAAEHMEDGNGGQYGFFVSHGERQGLITMKNFDASTKISFMSAPVVIKNGILRKNASIENFSEGALIDGITLLDSAAIDQWGAKGTIQNCLATLTPSGGGPTGYGTAIVLRNTQGKCLGNVIRFNTLITKNFKCLTICENNAGTQWYGNVMLADGEALHKDGGLQAADASQANYNVYGPKSSLSGASLADWQAKGFDKQSVQGEPKFANAAGGDYSLQPGSTGLDAAKVDATAIPPTDIKGRKRPAGTAADAGAFEKP